MQNYTLLCKKAVITLLLALSVLCGCSTEKIETENKNSSATNTETVESKENTIEPIITEVNWANYFDGINGSAVIYNPADNSYQIYNQEMALSQRSPCSTFKIISSLIALENKIIIPDNSVRTWSGEVFWNEDWNRDINFEEAYRTSCVIDWFLD